MSSTVSGSCLCQQSRWLWTRSTSSPDEEISSVLIPRVYGATLIFSISGVMLCQFVTISASSGSLSANEIQLPVLPKDFRRWLYLKRCRVRQRALLQRLDQLVCLSRWQRKGVSLAMLKWSSLITWRISSCASVVSAEWP